MPPKPNYADIAANVRDLLDQLRPYIDRRDDEHWMSITEAAYELELTPAYVTRLASQHKLAGYVTDHNEWRICAQHVAAERAYRMTKRLRHRRRG